MMTDLELSGLSQTHLAPITLGVKSFLVHAAIHSDLLALRESALKNGFDLCIASGFRSFQQQATIWDQKYSGQRAVLDSDSNPIDISSLRTPHLIEAILRWSALPGASRHHWGTDFDVYCATSRGNDSLKLEPWEYFEGHQAHFFKWLESAISDHGFFLPYRKDLGGVHIEPWHISHKNTASKCLEELTVQHLDQVLEQSHILGKEQVRENLESIYNQFIINISN